MNEKEPGIKCELSKAKGKSWVIQLLQRCFCPVIIFNTAFFSICTIFFLQNVFFIGVLSLRGLFQDTERENVFE